MLKSEKSVARTRLLQGYAGKSGANFWWCFLESQFQFLLFLIFNGVARETCRAEQIYAIFGTITERHFRKKIQSTVTYGTQMMQRCAPFFSRESRSVTVPRFGCFPGFTGKGLG